MKDIAYKIDEIFQLSDSLKKLPNRITRLNIIPDDALHGFPFAILSFKEKYLVEQFAISINYKSLPFSLFDFHRKKQKKALLVGISYKESGYSYLPNVSKEIDSIGKILEKGKISINAIKDKAISKNALLEKITDLYLFHIACHGVFNSENPDLSGLILGNGETLTLRDIWTSKQFQNVNHINLSSCWAADNFILPNKWILSLPETFLRAGVQSVLGCYWEVSDTAAVKFMEKFHKFSSHHPRDIALQKTQILAIKNELNTDTLKTEHIFYWAGFNLFGKTEES